MYVVGSNKEPYNAFFQSYPTYPIFSDPSIVTSMYGGAECCLIYKLYKLKTNLQILLMFLLVKQDSCSFFFCYLTLQKRKVKKKKNK